jgi:hypothetical protein
MEWKVKMKKKKIFRVGFWYTIYGTALHVEAGSKEEAEERLKEELAENGIDEIEYLTSDRDYGTQDAEEEE